MNRRTNIRLAIESLIENKFRSGLTALGIIFGIAAVVTMIAIGNGAQQQIIAQIEKVGAKNIIIRPRAVEDDGIEDKVTSKYSPKLSVNDVVAIEKVLPNVEKLTPFVSYSTSIIANGKKSSCNIVGVNSSYFSIYNLALKEGAFFSRLQEKKADAVCIIGSNVAVKLFGGRNPIGKKIRAKQLPLSIVGVIAPGEEIDQSLKEMGMNNYNDEVFIPVNTALRRYKNRGRITEKSLRQNNENDEENINSVKKETSEIKDQIEKIIVSLKNTEYVNASVEVLYRQLLRLHNGVKDFEIVVPEQILQQKKQTDDVFNILLGVIAGISLLVGGIGIMNIMLASVLERIREIGLRMAVGAEKQDIKEQFVFEAGLISLIGGVMGIFLGIILSYLAEWLTGTPTIVSMWSIIVSFFVSALVGIVFGYMPAKRAAEQDPVQSLRHD